MCDPKFNYEKPVPTTSKIIYVVEVWDCYKVVA